MKIITDEVCGQIHGPYKRWNEGNFTGIGVGVGNIEDLWNHVGKIIFKKPN